MSPRYYLVSGIIVFILTIIISWWKKTKSAKEFLFVFFQVLLLLTLLVGIVISLVELSVYLGVAESGFIVKQGELK
jgi:hypothetical protein